MVHRTKHYRFDSRLAIAHLREIDSGLKQCIDSVGDFKLLVRRNRSVFEYLSRSIVYQQLTGRAAETIYGRLLDNFSYRRIQPSHILAMDIGDLQAVGLSRSKCKALHCLAESALVGTLPKAAELHEMTDNEIVERLTLIWGIGQWTAEMLLIFYLGRPDVLPINDLGILKGYQRVRGYSTLPPVGRLERAGKRWRPYRTVASWYLWRILDSKK